MANEGAQKSLRLSIVVSGGSGTGTVTNEWVNCRWVRVIPVNETDSYTLTIKDADGYIMLLRTGQVGTLAEKVELSLGIMKTIQIASASVDGTYIVKFDCH